MTFEAVYDAHFEFVWRSLRQLGVAEADANDAAQDVFVVVHKRLAEFEGRSKITTWLFAICLRVAVARRRRGYARREQSVEDPLPEQPDSSQDPHRAAQQREALE